MTTATETIRNTRTAVLALAIGEGLEVSIRHQTGREVRGEVEAVTDGRVYVRGSGRLSQVLEIDRIVELTLHA
jgi:hypothetical protein